MEHDCRQKSEIIFASVLPVVLPVVIVISMRF